MVMVTFTFLPGHVHVDLVDIGVFVVVSRFRWCDSFLPYIYYYYCIVCVCVSIYCVIYSIPDRYLCVCVC